MMRRIAMALTAGTLVVAAAGCESVEEQLGLTKNPPDEFRVVSRAPLSMPPDFQLRPPRAGAPRPQEGSPTDQARQAVFRNTDESSGIAAIPEDGRSQGERAFLLQAGAADAKSDIRQIVNREARLEAEESESFVEDLLFWREAPEPGGRPRP